MSNPLFDSIRKLPQMTQMPQMGMFGNSPMRNIMQFMNEYKKLKANPSELGEFLYSKGKINQNQLNEINQMNGDPSKIGQYLLQSGSIPQNQANQLQNEANQMQQYINNQK